MSLGGVPMKLGTIAYKNRIYNLDYMNVDELKWLLREIESDKKENFNSVKEMLKNNK